MFLLLVIIFYLFLGDTGPLVYPSFFVYIYSALYFLTSRGKNIELAQFVFIGIYLLQLWLVLRLYTKSRKLPPYIIILSVFTSYRIHSIYSLRLFNDPVAILFFYIALNLFMDGKWSLGSVIFSLAVGIKMNILLFAPAILLLYIACLGYLKTIYQLAICAVVQVIIGLPFLLTYPFEYIRGSFDLGRVFEHKWTVNYRFLDKEIFENSSFHIALLLLHLVLLTVVAKPCFLFFKNYARLRSIQAQFEPQIAAENRELQELARQKMKRMKKKMMAKDGIDKTKEELSTDQKKFLKSFESGLKTQFGDQQQPPLAESKEDEEKEDEDPKKIEIHFDQCVQLALLPIFLVNFIGIVCARSLHYQFYVWYFHSLPYLSWFTDFHTSFKLLILFLIEFCWNQYPSTDISSALLHACHTILLFGVIHKLYKEVGMVKKVTKQN